MEGTAFQGVSVIRDPADHPESPPREWARLSHPFRHSFGERHTASGVAEGGVVDLNGAYRARTSDLLLAKQLLSQLS